MLRRGVRTSGVLGVFLLLFRFFYIYSYGLVFGNLLFFVWLMGCVCACWFMVIIGGVSYIPGCVGA